MIALVLLVDACIVSALVVGLVFAWKRFQGRREQDQPEPVLRSRDVFRPSKDVIEALKEKGESATIKTVLAKDSDRLSSGVRTRAQAGRGKGNSDDFAIKNATPFEHGGAPKAADLTNYTQI